MGVFDVFRSPSLGLKLSVIAGVPLLLFIFSLAGDVRQLVIEQQDLEQSTALVHLDLAAGDFAAELRSERGLSSLFLTSGADSHLDELTDQWVKTDAALDTLGVAVNAEERSLRGQYAEMDLVEVSDSLGAMRRSVASADVPWDASFSFYTTLAARNARLVSDRAFELLASDPWVHQLLEAADELAFAAEAAGQERAVISTVLAGQALRPDDLEFLTSLIPAQQDHLERALSDLPDTAFSEGDALASALVAPDEITAARLAVASEDFSMDPIVWWALSTDRIDSLGTMRESLHDTVLYRVDTSAAKARTSMWLNAAVAVTALLLATWVTYRLSADLNSRTRALGEVAGSFHDGDFSQRADTDSKDAIGRLGSEFNHMASELQSTFKALAESVQAEQRAVELKDRFLVSVSHELRTPLTEALGFLTVLTDPTQQLEDAEREEFRALAMSATQQMGFMVDDLLVAARLGASYTDDIVLRLSAFNLESVVQQITVAQVPLEVELADGETSPNVFADPDRVRQIVRNLHSNAVTYGGSAIRLSVSQATDFSVCLTVSDDGDGVAGPLTETLFDPYVTSGSSGGLTTAMGIGLWLSRELARQMGGELTYKRSDGWTSFELILPSTHPVFELVESRGSALGIS